MPLNGSGGVTQPSGSIYPATASTLIESGKFNTSLADVYTILASCIFKDGQQTTTAAIPFASGIQTDTIAEKTAATGVTVDGVLLKDSTAEVTEIRDTNGNESVKVTATASAVNEITVANAATGSGPTISATGGDTNIDLVIASKGTGVVALDDDDFAIRDPASPTKKVRFDAGSVTAGQTRVVSVPDKDITLGDVTESGFTTGDVKLTLKTAADTGWVLMDDGTIGNASSSGTTRANADTEDLFTLLWTNTVDADCPVSSGRGASAAADFAANKTITLPQALGRALATYGAGSVTAAGADADVDTTNDTLTVATNDAKWITGMAVVFNLTSGTITGLTDDTTYYVIRNSSTTIKLATSLANAQNGTAINLTAKSSPVWDITYSLTSRALGSAVGEESHAMTSTELLSHSHPQGAVSSGANFQSGGSSTTLTNTGLTGGNASMNIMGPQLFLNVMIKL